jgi:hypothetical protein
MPKFNDQPVNRPASGNTGSRRLDDPYGVQKGRDFQKLLFTTRSHGGRILSDQNKSTFHIVSPAGRNWGQYDVASNKFTGGDLSQMNGKSNKDLYDITDELDGE